jgi:hypothetical protein
VIDTVGNCLAGVDHNGGYPRAVEEGLIAEVGISHLRIAIEPRANQGRYGNTARAHRCLHA